MSTTLAKSIDDVLTEARATINDSNEPYRNTDALLVSYLNTALRELYRYRPEAFMGAFNTAGANEGSLTNNASPLVSFETSDLGQNPATALPVDDRLYFNPLVFFVAGRTELSDDEFTDNNRAMTLLQAFRAMLVTPGG